jgi:hypothetical protein
MGFSLLDFLLINVVRKGVKFIEDTYCVNSLSFTNDFNFKLHYWDLSHSIALIIIKHYFSSSLNFMNFSDGVDCLSMLGAEVASNASSFSAIITTNEVIVVIAIIVVSVY